MSSRERERKNWINNFARAIEPSSRRWWTLSFSLSFSQWIFTRTKCNVAALYLFIPLKLFCDCITPPLLTFRVVGIIWVCLFRAGRAEATHRGERCPPTSRWRTVWWCFGRILRPPRLTVASQIISNRLMWGMILFSLALFSLHFFVVDCTACVSFFNLFAQNVFHVLCVFLFVCLFIALTLNHFALCARTLALSSLFDRIHIIAPLWGRRWWDVLNWWMIGGDANVRLYGARAMMKTKLDETRHSRSPCCYFSFQFRQRINWKILLMFA